MESENLDTCSTILTDALKFIPGEARDLLRNAPRIAIDLIRLRQSQTLDGPTVISLSFFSKGNLFLIFVVIQIKIIHTYLSMTRTIVRVFYNPVENSPRRHPPYPSEISIL